jgi:hypothetical protein
MGFGVHCGPAANLGLGFFLSSFILVLFALRFSEQRRMLRENCEGEDIFESKLFIKKKKKTSGWVSMGPIRVGRAL